MEIIISVSYIVDTEKEAFWDETGYLASEIRDELNKKFPPDIEVYGRYYGKRSKLSYIPLGTGSEKCPLCHRWMTAEPEYYSALQLARNVNGTLYCESCAYEVQADLDHK